MTTSLVRTFRLSRLYFRYVLGTPWEREYTAESLAELLVTLDLIRLHENGTRYSETPKFRRYSFRHNFLKDFEKLKTRYNELGDV